MTDQRNEPIVRPPDVNDHLEVPGVFGLRPRGETAADRVQRVRLAPAGLDEHDRASTSQVIDQVLEGARSLVSAVDYLGDTINSCSQVAQPFITSSFCQRQALSACQSDNKQENAGHDASFREPSGPAAHKAGTASRNYKGSGEVEWSRLRRTDVTTGSGCPGVTGLLVAWGDGDEAALDQLVPIVHAELRRTAARYMSHERAGHTLQATALVNELLPAPRADPASRLA